jgi:hypothetical protein
LKKCLLIFLLNFPTFISASELIPELSGTIKISVEKGTIDADFQLTSLPKLNNYLIHLNSGFNIQYFRNEKDGSNYSYEKIYDAKYSEESFGYFFKDKISKNKFIPDTLQFKYTGKFPVITDMSKATDEGDSKGNIAFNGKHIRTDGFQTAWYPILYDIDNDNDKRYDEVIYDIEVTCLDCKSIYVNGSKPISSTRGRFKRDKPTSIMLFAGDYNIAEYNRNYYLNTGLSEQQMSELAKLTSAYINYYEDKLSIPYGESVTYIETAPISKYDSWYFVVYPSIVAMTHEEGFTSIEASWFKSFIAHELAHYYFGTYKKFNSELGDIFTEAFAEYLSLKTTKDLLGNNAYLNRVNRKLSELENIKFNAFQDIQSELDYGDRGLYVYTYAPIIWLAIEKEIGQEKMWRWIKNILKVENTRTDYKFMLKTLGEVLKNDLKLKLLVEKYFTNSKAIDNAKALIIQ